MKYCLQRLKISPCILLLLLTMGSYAQDSSKNITSSSTDTIPPGVQGSVNPLTDNTPVYTGDQLLDARFPNSWPIFGSGVRMSIGGYVKADFIQDFDYVGDRFEFETGSIAVKGTPERDLGGVSTFHAKQSRVNFDLRSSAKWKNGKEFPMQVFIEFDWFFDSEAQRFNTRLRHAYGVVGRLLVGRTWTTSGDLSSLPGLIDFAGGDAVYGGRATQIRFQDEINSRWKYAVALEDASGQIANPNNIAGAFRPKAPNLASMIKWHKPNGTSIQLGLDLFPMSWAGPSTVPNVTEMGYAVTGTGRVVVKRAKHNDAFLWGAGFGQGQAHKIIALSWDGKASGVVDQTGLNLAPAWFGFAGYNHYWSNRLNSTVSTNWGGTDLSPLQTPNTITKAGTVHANLIWFPYPLISTGIEYMWGMRENKDGMQGTATRLQCMVKFKFN